MCLFEDLYEKDGAFRGSESYGVHKSLQEYAGTCVYVHASGVGGVRVCGLCPCACVCHSCDCTEIFLILKDEIKS